MRHRLGRFEPKPGSSVYDSLHLHTKLSPLLTRALENKLQTPLAPVPAERGTRRAARDAFGPVTRADDPRPFQGLAVAPGPDLLSQLRYGHPDRVWVVSVKNQLEEIARGLEFRLLACEYEPGPDGYLAIAGVSASIAARVREADPVVAGFVALRERELPVRVIPRAFRVVSATGALVSARDDEAGAHGFLVEEQVLQCFDHDRFLPVADQLRRAAAAELLSLPEEVKQSGDRERIEARWREDGDRTLYGLMNAVSAEACDRPDFRERLALEELAGSLARLTHGPRSRRPDPVPPPVLV